jgi:L-threonylcarbamoyladenylate synthase
METARSLPSEVTAVVYGSRSDTKTIAAGLYDALRHFDTHVVDVIFVEGVKERGLGAAIMNRLKKAAKEVL